VNISPEKQMWQSVVMQAFLDASASTGTGGAPSSREKAEAIAWIMDCRSDFRMACSLAGLSATQLSKSFRDGRVDFDAIRVREKSRAVTSKSINDGTAPRRRITANPDRVAV